MFRVHKNGPFYEWIVLQSDDYTKELQENDHNMVNFL